MRSCLVIRTLAVGLLVALAACGPTQDESGPDTGAEPIETDAPDPDAPDPDNEVSVDGDDIEAAVIADAAARADVDEGEVELVAHEQVTWSDGSLGCPQPDQFYTQALIEGYRIVVEAGGQTLHYHGQQGGPPSYCEDPQDPADTGGTVDR